MPAIAIRHLSKTFEQKGTRGSAAGYSLDIEEGDTTESLELGAGKVPERCLNYLERPDER